MAWVAEVIADDSGKWAGNSVYFATEQEALAAGRNLMDRWTMVSNYRASEIDKPVNYRWDDTLKYPACLISVASTEA